MRLCSQLQGDLRASQNCDEEVQEAKGRLAVHGAGGWMCLSSLVSSTLA